MFLMLNDCLSSHPDQAHVLQAYRFGGWGGTSWKHLGCSPAHSHSPEDSPHVSTEGAPPPPPPPIWSLNCCVLSLMLRPRMFCPGATKSNVTYPRSGTGVGGVLWGP